MKYSIILPVRNGGDYVKECVDSILRQSLPDFNLEILDNYSTDGTSQWLADLADPRIRIYPAERPLTIEENWGRIITIPKNEFITLIGHDDRLDGEYLSVMNNLIAKHPRAALYQAHFRFIDARGKTKRNCQPMAEVQSAAEFLSSFLSGTIDVMGTGFMMRAADYDQVGGIPPYPSLLFADFDLWINLTRKSYKATAAQNCFAFRVHQSTTTISADNKLHKGFEQFVVFLQKLGAEDPLFNETIKRYAPKFLDTYSTSFSHRLLRTPPDQRQNLTVSHIIEEFEGYADRLGISDSYCPDQIKMIRLARRIDESTLLRRLFLFFKKIWSKPLRR